MPAQVLNIQEFTALRSKRLEMTFQLDPQVSITLKGKVYTLEFNNFAAKNILKETLYNLLERGLDRDALNNPEVMGAMVYWGLKTHHPDLTQDDADKLFTQKHYPYITDKLVQALSLFQADMGDVELQMPQTKDPNEDPLKPSTVGG